MTSDLYLLMRVVSSGFILSPTPPVTYICVSHDILRGFPLPSKVLPETLPDTSNINGSHQHMEVQ